MDKQTQKNLLELVKRNYEEIAEDFDTTRKKQLWPELLKLAGMVKDGNKILDVGCGNGRLIEAFRDKKINYLGVDSSEKLVEAAKKNLQAVISAYEPESRVECDKQVSGLRVKPAMTNKNYAPRNDNNSYKFKNADILELDKLPEHDFDYVFCIAVLHHLPGADLRVRALEQMKDKLKPGGKIIITVWNLWRQKKFSRLIFKYGLLKLTGVSKMDFGDILFDWKNNRGENVSQRYYHAFTNNRLKQIAVRVGFKIEKLYKDKYNYYLILEK